MNGTMRRTLAGQVVGSVLLSGCYTLQPVGSAVPQQGQRVALEINDEGRVALGGLIGPAITRIEGTLIQQEADAYLLSVRSVRYVHGGEQVWSGERLRVSRNHVSSLYERQLSKGRSWAFGVATIGSFAAFMLTRDLLGLGQTDNPDPGPKPIPVELVRP